jgi:RNA polymerase sigma factor (sigma-70 family)
MRIQAKIQLKNYELLERRTKLGYTQIVMGIACGIDHQRYSNIENIKVKPTLEEAEDIAEVLQCAVKVLFPEGYEKIVENVKNTDFVKVADYVPPLLTQSNQVLRLDAKLTVAKMLSVLTPKERKIIEMRNGTGEYNGVVHTFKEIADEFGISVERVRQIEAKINVKLHYYYDEVGYTKKHREIYHHIQGLAR